MISSYALAKICRVSQGTVDRAIHGRPGVSETTRARILAVAEQHGYTPNPVPREMMGFTVSTMVGIITCEESLRRPFFMDLFAAMSPCLRSMGLVPSLWISGPEAEEQRTTVIAAAARRPRALILVVPPPDLVIAEPVARAQPVLSLVTPCAGVGVINVLPDEREIGRVATRHLIDLGHRAIVHLAGGAPPHWAREERAAGYVETMRAAGLVPHVLWNAVEDADLLDRLAETGASAVFCHNDRLVVVLLRRLRERGCRVPQDLSVLGVDRSPIMASLDIAVTTVPYPIAGVAAQVQAHIAGGIIPPLPQPQVMGDGLTAIRLRR